MFLIWFTNGVLCSSRIVLSSGWGNSAPVPASVIVFVVSDCFSIMFFCSVCVVFLYFWDCISVALVSGRFTLFCLSLVPLFTFSPVLLLILSAVFFSCLCFLCSYVFICVSTKIAL